MTQEGETKASSWLDSPLLSSPKMEIALYLLLIAVAALLRFWDLGARAVHHDESLHATYSWYLYVGRGYEHNPMMHGPFQFAGNALSFFLFGASDASARYLYAFFGTALVGLPFLLRHWLGRWGGLTIAALLAFSPSMLYFSRFARNDILIALWTLALVVCLWRYLEERRPLYLYLGAAFLGLSFATKEVTYITVAILGSFLLLVTVREWGGQLKKLDLSHLSPAASFLLLLGTLSLPQLAALSNIVLKRWGLDPAQAIVPGAPKEGLIAGTVVTLGLLGLTVLIGTAWNRRTWLFCALVFYSIYVVLYTAFFTNLPGVATGVWGSLDYWLAQHGVQRGGQPWFYYLVLTSIYEFLPLLIAIPAGIYYVRKGDLFSSFLVYWAAAAFILYSYAGEKMPWLVLHLTLPLVLLSGKFLGEQLPRIDWRKALERGGLLLIVLLPLIPLELRLVGAGPTTQKALLLVIGALLAALALGLAWRMGTRLSLQLAGVSFLALLVLFSFRAAWNLSYRNGDVPVEMMVYTQTSPQLHQLMKEIDRLALATGKGKEMEITVDGADGFSWPWVWYLRDYKNVQYVDMAFAQQAPTGRVLLLNLNNQEKAKPYLGNYGPGVRYAHRWWFPEEHYRGISLGQAAKDLTQPRRWQEWWDYFMYRKTLQPLGSVDAVAYFPKGWGFTGP